MNVETLHAGFDGLRVNVAAQISRQVRNILVSAKEQALEVKSPVPVAVKDQNLTGNLIARAVASEVKPDEFWDFAR
ncbi:hypothetical protein [Rhodophyticola porphyridii]|uniref:Uncharacterized protein n=1 Tax=Rhodophyticola porphyridii TaxID=1852017 RepID=A0A3L9Y4P5_9RHOB|nr:hypothetical protein [Rhodophyticola porphyridii]RMA43312.1 hypothetical protein D9R08_06810 [Rhodophyticola porphyridii]